MLLGVEDDDSEGFKTVFRFLQCDDELFKDRLFFLFGHRVGLFEARQFDVTEEDVGIQRIRGGEGE